MRALFIVLSGLPLFMVGCSKPVVFTEKKVVPEYAEINTKKDIVSFSDTTHRIVPYIYTSVISLNPLPVDEKKRKFAEMMLPAILKTQFQLKEKIRRVEHIENWLKQNPSIIKKDSVFLYQLFKNYKCSEIDELKKRLQPHPASIVLGQAAIESGWGSSRFFEKANNVFGIWSYNKGENRIVALQGRDSTKIYVRKYSNIEESVEHYYRTIARVNAYKEFREKRETTNDPYQLIPLLHRYSEVGEIYTNNLKKLIKRNNLTQYDGYLIAEKYLADKKIELTKVPRFQL